MTLTMVNGTNQEHTGMVSIPGQTGTDMKENGTSASNKGLARTLLALVTYTPVSTRRARLTARANTLGSKVKFIPVSLKME